MPSLGIIASAQRTQSYGNLILSESGLVSYWRLGETSGTFADLKGVNTGTLVGADITRGVTGLINDPNAAITFGVAGTTRVDVSNNASLDLADTFTLECWFKRSETGTGSVYGFIDRGAGAYQTQIRFGFPSVSIGGTGSICLSSVSVVDLLRHHLMVTKTGASSKLYLDGVDRTSGTASGTGTNNGSSLGLGSDAGGGENFNGTLDECAIYSVVLTAAQALAHYNKGVNG